MATGELYRNAANNQLLLRDTKLIQVGLTSPLEIPGVISWFAELVNGGTDRATLSDLANINQWDDKSGNANHASGKQGQPTWEATSQSIYFNTTASLGNLSKQLTPANNICTVFLVANAANFGVNDAFYLWLSGSDNATSMNFVLQTADNQANFFINVTQTVITCTGQTAMSLYTIISTDGKSANATIKRNTITLNKTGGSTSTMTADAGFNIGGVIGGGVLTAYNQHYTYVKELITYNSALTTDQINSVESYLNTKYSLY